MDVISDHTSPKPLSPIYSYYQYPNASSLMNPIPQSSFATQSFHNQNIPLLNNQILMTGFNSAEQMDNSNNFLIPPLQVEHLYSPDLVPVKLADQCINIIDSKSQRKKFSPEEDLKLTQEVAVYGPRKWNQIALALPGRTARQCRDRFHNYLNPNLTNGPWTNEEDQLLEQKALELHQHWNKIAIYFKGRSANNIKNRWYTYISKKNRRQYKNKDKNHLRYTSQIEALTTSNNQQYKSTIPSELNNGDNKIKPTICTRKFAGLNQLKQNQNDNNKNNLRLEKGPELIEKTVIHSKKIVFPSISPENDCIAFWNNQKLFGLLTNDREQLGISGPISETVKT